MGTWSTSETEGYCTVFVVVDRLVLRLEGSFRFHRGDWSDMGGGVVFVLSRSGRCSRIERVSA